MENNERLENLEEIRKSNQRAIPKLVRMFVLCFLAGAVAGLVIGGLMLLEGQVDLGGMVRSGLQTFALACPPLLLAWQIIQIALGVIAVRRGKRLLAAWDGEDEETAAQLNTLISRELWLCGIGVIGSLFLFGGFYSAGTDSFSVGPVIWFGTAVVFAAGVILTLVFQSKMVDLARQMAPEKKVSPYDIKFQKKWYDQCDEAEQLEIGRCSWKAYQAIQRSCMVLWVVFTLTGLLLGTGILPILAVCLLWLVGNSAYAIQGMKSDLVC